MDAKTNALTAKEKFQPFKAYMTLFNRIAEPVAIFNDSGLFLSNLAFRDYFGPDVKNTETFRNIISDKDKKRVWPELMRSTEKKGHASGISFEASLYDGKVVGIECDIDSIQLSGEKALQIVFRILPSEKERETVSQKDLEDYFQAQKWKSLGALVSGVSHEINNPVNLIVLNIHSISKAWVDFLPYMKEISEKEPYVKFGGLDAGYLEKNMGFILEDIDIAAKKIADIIGKLKHFVKKSRMMDKSFVNLNKAVLKAGKMWSMAALKSYTELEMDLKSDLPDIEGSLSSLEQIVYNLLVNADEAIYHDKGKIRVTTRRNDENHVLLTVEDNGRGISDKIQDTLFDPFVTDRLDQGGTGLGLSITYSLVKAHGGNISFETRKGEGTAFQIEFPVDRNDTKR